MRKAPTPFQKRFVPECEYSIGDTVHIKGKPCRLVGGSYWGSYGLSNFWFWREVYPDGTLGPQKRGYGAQWKIIKKKNQV